MANSADEKSPNDRPFERLVQAVTDYAIYMIDLDGTVVTWNPGAERVKGYRPDEIIGQNFSRFFTPEDLDADLPQHSLRIAARDGHYEMEGWRVRKDGSRFLAHVVMDGIRNEDGLLTGFAKVTRDITDKRNRERALYESEQRFRLLVRGVQEYAIYMLSPDGRVTNWNPGARAIKGYEEAEIVGQHFSRFYTEEDRNAGVPERALATALREGKYEREAWRVRKDGTLFWAHVLIDPIFDETGAHVGYAKITRDESERKEASEQLQKTQAALLQAQKLQALGELTGGIAHDFNNLMTVIGGSVDMLIRRPDLPEEKRQRYLNAISETTERATKLTAQLLAFGRRQPLEPEVLDLNMRVDALADMLQRTIGSSYHLDLDLAPDLWLAEVDPTGLETAILNAVLNARDAMPLGGRLTIATDNAAEADGDKVRLSITDTGEGISADQLERVFEPFFTTKPVGKGTGLGLSQIHGFVAQSGGRADIQSTVGAGTTVRLVLPRVEKALSVRASRPNRAEIPRGLRVLLVEDNDRVRDFARQLLVDLHCEVVESASAEEAMSILHDEIDFVFSDVVMPGKSGITLASEIRSVFADLPILLATGYSEQLLPEQQRQFDILRKPYKLETLAAALSRSLEAAP